MSRFPAMEDRTAKQLIEAIESLTTNIDYLAGVIQSLGGLIEDDLVPALKDSDD